MFNLKKLQLTNLHVQALVTALISLLIGWIILGELRVDWTVPVVYDGDGLMTILVIKRITEGAWYFFNDIQGAPFGAIFLDFPSSDLFSLLFLKVVGELTQNPFSTFNIFVLLSFPANAVVAFYVMRDLKISPALAIVGGITFTLIPFHFYRLSHTFYLWYFAAPLATWLSFKIYQSHDAAKIGLKKIAGFGLLLFTLSSCGVYFAFFSVLMFAAAGLTGAFSSRSKKPLIYGLIFVVVTSAGVGVNISPSKIYLSLEGPNSQVAVRSPIESEMYGLKLVHMLLPTTFHRSGAMRSIAGKHAQFPLNNENRAASIGLIASIGLLLLIFSLLFATKIIITDYRVYLLSVLSLFLLLFATIGGFASLFAMFVSPSLRAWNRISIFIGFLSIAGFMIFVEMAILKLYSTRNTGKIIAYVAGFLLLVAIYDQTPPLCKHCIEPRNVAFNNDKVLVEKIEAQMPEGGMIYQLPFMVFPESPAVFTMPIYGLSRPYLHSTKLKWSYGCMNGRECSDIYSAFSKKTELEQFLLVQEYGFAGLTIDRRGFADRAASLEQQILAATGKKPDVVSLDKNTAFYSFADGGKISLDAAQVKGRLIKGLSPK